MDIFKNLFGDADDLDDATRNHDRFTNVIDDDIDDEARDDDRFTNVFDDNDDIDHETRDDNARLRLRKEELDITKNRVQKGEVELGKEIIEEREVVDVPVEREEVIIERRSLNNERSDSPITNEETIHIPVSEEVIDVDKHTIVTGEISAHKRVIEDTRHVDETLRREEARINRIGDADVIDSDEHRD